MKNLVIALFAALTAVTSAADSPADIVKTYHERAAVAMERLNDTLAREGSAIAAQLLKSGDAAGAEQVTSSVRAKTAGEPILNPHFSVTMLFQQYDKARAEVLRPHQQAAYKRIDAAVEAAGANISLVEELLKARRQIGFPQPEIPRQWTYHIDLTAKATASLKLLSNGILEWTDGGDGKVKSGTWKPQEDGMRIEFLGETWDVVVRGGLGTINRPKVGIRYLRAAP